MFIKGISKRLIESFVICFILKISRMFLFRLIFIIFQNGKNIINSVLCNNVKKVGIINSTWITSKEEKKCYKNLMQIIIFYHFYSFFLNSG